MTLWRKLLPWTLLLTAGVVLGAALNDGPPSAARPGPPSAPAPVLDQALALLLRAPSGRELVEHAMRVWKMKTPEAVLSRLRWGAASKTDAVLTRHYDPGTGAEKRERQVIVYLREGQDLPALVLDLAHELVHATSKAAWDPYDPALTPAKYIWSSLEGDGGEVDAVTRECSVGLQVLDSAGASGDSSGDSSLERCRSYLTAGRIDREKVRRDFYRVGGWERELKSRLGKDAALFPLLSSQAPALYSSTGHAPYPVALYREFNEITQVACRNSERRLQRTEADRAEKGRSPAMARDALFLRDRCRL